MFRYELSTIFTLTFVNISTTLASSVTIIPCSFNFLCIFASRIKPLISSTFPTEQIFTVSSEKVISSTSSKDLLNISVKEVSDIIEDKDYISKVYEINSNADISEYVIESIDGFTDGTYLTNMNGNRQNKFKGGEQFKIMIPKKEITKDINGKISIKAKQKNYGIYYGCSMVEGFQDYALCNDEYSEVYTYTELNILTNKSKVIITKLDKGTSFADVAKEYEDKVLGATDTLYQMEYDIFCKIRDYIAENTARIQLVSSFIANLFSNKKNKKRGNPYA